MKKKMFCSVLLIGICLATISARPDLTDLVSKDMHAISGGGSFNLSFPYSTTDKNYASSSLSTNLYFGYEVFFRNKWSFQFSPAFSIYTYTNTTEFELSGTAHINYYFADHDFIPYIGMGISLNNYHAGSYYSFVVKPDFRIGFVKEIKDRFYFDASLGIPTFIGFTTDNQNTRFGFVDSSVPLYFGIRYYY